MLGITVLCFSFLIVQSTCRRHHDLRFCPSARDLKNLTEREFCGTRWSLDDQDVLSSKQLTWDTSYKNLYSRAELFWLHQQMPHVCVLLNLIRLQICNIHVNLLYLVRYPFLGHYVLFQPSKITGSILRRTRWRSGMWYPKLIWSFNCSWRQLTHLVFSSELLLVSEGLEFCKQACSPSLTCIALFNNGLKQILFLGVENQVLTPSLAETLLQLEASLSLSFPIFWGIMTVSLIDDSDSAVAYSGAWGVETELPTTARGGYYNNTLHSTSSINSTATLRFTGVLCCSECPLNTYWDNFARCQCYGLRWLECQYRSTIIV